MGFFKKKKGVQQASRILLEVNANATRKNAKVKGKSFRKRLGSVLRRRRNNKLKDSNKNKAESRFLNKDISHEVSILSPGETHRTLETETSSSEVDLDHGYEVVLGCNNAGILINHQRQKEKCDAPPVCGYDYKDVMKEIEHVECSPLDDWNNLVEFLMVPEMKKDIRKLMFGDDVNDNSDKPPIKVIQTPPSSPIPFDEMAEQDPTFYDEEKQMNSLIDRQNDDDTVTVLSNQPSLDHNGNVASETHDRKDSRASIASASIASASIASASVVTTSVATTLIDETNSNPLVQQNETLSSKMYPDSGASKVLPDQLVQPQASEEEVYDASFTLRFLREVTQVGIMLEYFKITGDGGPEENMKSTLVTISIKPGVSRGSSLQEPRLCWKPINAVCDNEDDGISIRLLEIHSIHTSLSQNETEDDDSPFFTITTETGDVYAFESPTLSERNHAVHGIKNVVAWLSYHLVMGTMASQSGFVSDTDLAGDSGDLPSLRTPVQAMNDLTHSFLD